MTTYDHDYIDAGSDFLDAERFPGLDPLPVHWSADEYEDDGHEHSRRSAAEWARIRRGPSPLVTTGPALLGLFARTYAMVLAGTMICAVIVCPPLAPFMLVGGLVVGIGVGLIMGLINTAVTAWAFTPLLSKAGYRTYTRGLLYGLVMATIGLGCAALVANLFLELTAASREPFETNLMQALAGVAYSAYAIGGCLLVARWLGTEIADQHVKAVWPELDEPLPTRRQLRRQAEAGGDPWG